jgi:hypothetical protein
LLQPHSKRHQQAGEAGKEAEAGVEATEPHTCRAQYSPMMRADFSLFDEYEYRRAGEAPFHFPITTFFATHDKKIAQGMVQGWQRFTTQVRWGRAVCGGSGLSCWHERVCAYERGQKKVFTYTTCV